MDVKMRIIAENSFPALSCLVNKLAVVGRLLLPLCLAACAFGYQAQGRLSDVPGTLRGKAFPGSTSGGGRFLLANTDGSLRCEGDMQRPDSSPMPGSCAGESGGGIVRCSDGREIAVRWRGMTCRTLQGEGTDDFGNRLEFRVDRR